MRIREHLTYANVVATLALVVAIAGGSTAIAISSKHKISGKLIKPGTIGAKQLKDGSVTAPKLAVIDTVFKTDVANQTIELPCPSGERLLSGGVSALSGQVTQTIGFYNSWLGAGSAGQVGVTALCLRATPGK